MVIKVQRRRRRRAGNVVRRLFCTFAGGGPAQTLSVRVRAFFERLLRLLEAPHTRSASGVRAEEERHQLSMSGIMSGGGGAPAHREPLPGFNQHEFVRACAAGRAAALGAL